MAINAHAMNDRTKVDTIWGTLSTQAAREKWPKSEPRRFKILKALFDAGADPYAIMLGDLSEKR